MRSLVLTVGLLQALLFVAGCANENLKTVANAPVSATDIDAGKGDSLFPPPQTETQPPITTESNSGESGGSSNLPMGLIYFRFGMDESRYYIFNMPRTWPEANSICKAMGGHLMVPNSEVELDFITARVSDYQVNRFWIGVNDVEVEDAFIAENGESPFYRFHEGEPNNHGDGEDYLEVIYYNAFGDNVGWQMNDLRGGGMNAFVCEFPV